MSIPNIDTAYNMIFSMERLLLSFGRHMASYNSCFFFFLFGFMLKYFDLRYFHWTECISLYERCLGMYFFIIEFVSKKYIVSFFFGRLLAYEHKAFETKSTYTAWR